MVYALRLGHLLSFSFTGMYNRSPSYGGGGESLLFDPNTFDKGGYWTTIDFHSKENAFSFTSSISMNSMISNRANITSGQKKTNSFTKLWRRAIYKKKEREKEEKKRLSTVCRSKKPNALQFTFLKR